jgi:hypothetical protein
MLFAPSSLNPDSISFDATKVYKFTFKNNGDVQTHYNLKIYNNSTSAQVYTSNKTASSISEHNLPANSLTNNLEYKYQLEVFSNAQSVLSEFIFFKTNTTPIITMTVPSSISTTSSIFSATYSQAQSIPFNKFKFILYDSVDEILLSSGWQYGYNLTYTFDGFVNNKTYKVECITDSQYSLGGSSGKKTFSVSFVAPDAANILQAIPDNNNGTVQIGWSSIDETYAKVIGTYSYVTGKFNKGVQLNAQSSITYEKNVPEDYTINFWVKLASGFVGNILHLGNAEFIVGYNGTRFYVKTNGDAIYSLPINLPLNFFKIAIISNKVIIQTDTQTEYI